MIWLLILINLKAALCGHIWGWKHYSKIKLWRYVHFSANNVLILKVYYFPSNHQVLPAHWRLCHPLVGVKRWKWRYWVSGLRWEYYCAKEAHNPLLTNCYEAVCWCKQLYSDFMGGMSEEDVSNQVSVKFRRTPINLLTKKYLKYAI